VTAGGPQLEMPSSVHSQDQSMPDAAQQEQEQQQQQQFADEEFLEMGEQRITIVCGPFLSFLPLSFFDSILCL